MRHLLFLIFTLSGCETAVTHSHATSNTETSTFVNNQDKKDTTRTYTQPCTETNKYIGFDAPKAINRIADIENEYFNGYRMSQSKYYGSVWKDNAKNDYSLNDSISTFDKYTAIVDDPMMMDCTIYSIQALKAGMGDDFKKMNSLHREIWGNGGYAGWSVGYLLTKHFNWKAYLVLSKHSKEYDQCLRNYKSDQKYHVWKQPDIPLEKVFSFENDQEQIDLLLNKHQFGWGFSEQGWHTWITRHDQLKECIWLGAPSPDFSVIGNTPLFRTTKLTEYYDYDSHIIVVPPLQE